MQLILRIVQFRDFINEMFPLLEWSEHPKRPDDLYSVLGLESRGVVLKSLHMVSEVVDDCLHLLLVVRIFFLGQTHFNDQRFDHLAALLEQRADQQERGLDLGETEFRVQGVKLPHRVRGQEPADIVGVELPADISVRENGIRVQGADGKSKKRTDEIMAATLHLR